LKKSIELGRGFKSRGFLFKSINKKLNYHNGRKRRKRKRKVKRFPPRIKIMQGWTPVPSRQNCPLLEGWSLR
jgi:hypothetical protein